MRNTAPFDVWVAPAHHITDLYYEEGEGQILRLGLRCRLSRQATAGAQLIRALNFLFGLATLNYTLPLCVLVSQRAL